MFRVVVVVEMEILTVPAVTVVLTVLSMICFDIGEFTPIKYLYLLNIHLQR